jgi:hypothetical protein
MKMLTLCIVLLAATGAVLAQAIDWDQTTSLPRASWRHACAATASHIYFLGGGTGPEASCDYAQVNPDGTLGQWTSTTALPAGIGWFSADATEGHVYVCGGWNLGGLTSAVSHAALDSTGAIGGWTATTSLPNALYTHGATIVDSCLYVLGGAVGVGGPTVADVRYARVQPDGSLGEWSSTSALPQALRIMGVAYHNGYLYSVGGRNDGGTAVSSVYYARRNPDGSLDQWNPATSLPAVIDGLTCGVVGDHIYTAGGMSTGAINSVYSVQVNPDGTLGNWVAETPLPAPRWASDGLAVSTRLYVPGGYLSEPYAEVYYSSPLTGVASPPTAAATLSLTARPTLTRGSTTVSFATTRKHEAILTVADVSGRVVLARRLAGLPAGQHAIGLPAPAPGRYCCRLQVGSSVATTQFVRLP